MDTDEKRDVKTSRHIGERHVKKVSWNIPSYQVEGLQRAKAKLRLDGLQVDIQDIVEWGIQQGLDSLKKGMPCREWLEERARRKVRTAK